MSGYWYRLSNPTIGDAEVEAAIAVLRSGNTTMGEVVEEFEGAFAHYVDAPHAVMVNSGSSADLLIALALGGGPVLIPAVTWPTHVWAWTMADERVNFCDVQGFNTTAELVERRLGRAKTLSLVHLMGVPNEMEEMVALAYEHGLTITEDCCEALGATYHERPVGSFGKAAAWSFFFSHQMCTMEGGMVTTTDADVADRVRSMRSHGWERHKGGDPYTFTSVGFNLRPTEVAAAIGLVQLNKLASMNKLRAENHDAFCALLADHPDITFPTVPKDCQPSWFGLPMLVHRDRDGLARHLEWSGVETRPILGGNLARQPAFSGFDFGPTPGADYVSDHGLYVGLHPDADSGVDEVALLIGEYLGG